MTELVDSKFSELEESLKIFMKLLQDDISSILGKEIPFIVKLDIRLGVRQEDEDKMKKYEPKLIKLLNSMPNTTTNEYKESANLQ